MTTGRQRQPPGGRKVPDSCSSSYRRLFTPVAMATLHFTFRKFHEHEDVIKKKEKTMTTTTNRPTQPGWRVDFLWRTSLKPAAR